MTDFERWEKPLDQTSVHTYPRRPNIRMEGAVLFQLPQNCHRLCHHHHQHGVNLCEFWSASIQLDNLTFHESLDKRSKLIWAVVVAQLVEQSLLTPRGPRFVSSHQQNLCWKDENTEKVAVNGPFCFVFTSGDFYFQSNVWSWLSQRVFGYQF